MPPGLKILDGAPETMQGDAAVAAPFVRHDVVVQRRIAARIGSLPKILPRCFACHGAHHPRRSKPLPRGAPATRHLERSVNTATQPSTRATSSTCEGGTAPRFRPEDGGEFC